MKRAWISTLLKYVVGLAVLAWVIKSHWHTIPAIPATAETAAKPEVPGIDQILSKPINYGAFATALVLVGMAAILTFIRWHILVRALDLPQTFRSTFRLALYGYFFNTLLPGAIGGDLVKAGAMLRTPERKMAGVASVLFDRVVGLAALALLMVLSGAFFYLSGDPTLRDQPKLLGVWRTTAIVVGVAAVGWYLLRFFSAARADRFAGRLSRLPVVGHHAEEAWRSVLMYRTRPKAVTIALSMTLIVHLFNVIAFDRAAHVFEADASKLPSVAEHFVIVPVGMTVKAFIPTPGGVGGAEFSYGWLYEMIGRDASFGVLASLAIFLVTISLAACAAVASQLITDRRIELENKID